MSMEPYSRIIALETRSGSFRINLAGEPGRVDLLAPRLKALARDCATPRDAMEILEEAMSGTGTYIADVFDVGSDFPQLDVLAAVHEIARKSLTAEDALESLGRVFRLASAEQVTSAFRGENANWARDYVRQLLDDMDERRELAATELQALLGRGNYYLVTGEA